ncbi:Protein kinase [Gracilaria domingensis]|nr:Protein kinase [Gracilaria domingensis]
MWGTLRYPAFASSLAPYFVPWNNKGRLQKCSRKLSVNQQPRALLVEFSPGDFEIRRLVGQQGYATITDWEYYVPKDPLAPTRTIESNEPSVRLYEAVITVSQPTMFNTRVLLKEFLTDGVELGVNEAEAYKTLYEADGGPAAIDPDIVPVATLLGTFITDESFADQNFRQAWRSQFPNAPNAPRVGAPFLVFRWEGLKTGLSCAAPRRDADEIGNRLFDNIFRPNLLRRQALFVRRFMKLSIEALLYVHGTGGIVHRSIGLASIMVNTIEYRLVSSLQVKFRDFGFARPVSELVTGKNLERARRAGAVTPSEIAAYHFAEDIYALGYAFLELIFSTFSGKPVTQDRFKKLFEDTFDLDIVPFREYCTQDPDWLAAVEFLDEENESGWDLVKRMIGARKSFTDVSLKDIKLCPFLKDVA